MATYSPIGLGDVHLLRLISFPAKAQKTVASFFYLILVFIESSQQQAVNMKLSLAFCLPGLATVFSGILFSVVPYYVDATWSIIATDRATGQVGVAATTCRSGCQSKDAKE